MATIENLKETQEKLKVAAINYGRVQMLHEIVKDILKIEKECERQHEFHNRVLDYLCEKVSEQNDNSEN